MCNDDGDFVHHQMKRSKQAEREIKTKKKFNNYTIRDEHRIITAVILKPKWIQQQSKEHTMYVIVYCSKANTPTDGRNVCFGVPMHNDDVDEEHMIRKR